ncbi:MAG TPA: hypothetical protein VH394_25100 [Thermoanaerobaculia bacterium]|jgi:hypothetical protein|nr:hypothetical protein [Thermoanaerobaculia bacterium]
MRAAARREPLSLNEAAAITLPEGADRLQRTAFIAGLVALAVCVLGAVLNPDYFFRAWLVGWVYWVGVALGCLALSLLHHLTHGDWGIVLRRAMEAATRTLPGLLVLGLPLLLGMPRLYPWARPEAAHDELLQAKAPYLNVPFFAVRFVLYFLIWGGLAFLMSRMSRRQDQGDDPGITRRMQVIAAPSLAAYCLAVTFASVDWLMSLQPAWFSTIYGVYLMGSQGLAALAFLIAFGLWLSRREPMDRVLHPRLFHDYGKLMLAFVMLWAYFSFSQFLIMWAGNLPEEIHFYLHRFQHGWGAVSLALVLFHFALPFVLLLSRDLKRDAGRLVWVAGLMLVMRWIDLVWQVEPAFDPKQQSPAMYWMYLAAPIAIGGLWLAYFLRELRSRPMLPVNDPYLPEALVP